MKKWIALLLMMAVVLSMTACERKNDIENEHGGKDSDDIPESYVGTWVTVAGFPESDIPEDMRSLLEANVHDVQIVSYLASKGNEYAFLCHGEDGFEIITVTDSSGKCKVTRTAFKVWDYAGADAGSDAGIAAEGWDYYYPMKACELDFEVSQTFSTAFRDFGGEPYIPMSYLATQLVSGINHVFLCSGRTMGKDAAPNIYIVTVYAPIDGGASVLSIRTLDLEAIL